MQEKISKVKKKISKKALKKYKDHAIHLPF